MVVNDTMLEVYVMSTNQLKEEKNIQRASLLLSKEDQEQIQRCAEGQRYAKLAGTLLLYYACHKHGITRIEIQKNRHGKPYLTSVDAFHFNLSHSGTMVALICADTPVGVDIEKIRTKLPKHLNKILSLEEQSFLEQQTDPYTTFTTLWSRKESYVKQKGGRIFDHPERFVMAGEQGYDTKIGECHLQSFVLSEYVLSVCVPQQMDIPPYQYVTLQDIFSQIS